jgi:hypothetical protein
MGDAFVAVANDYNALFYNPAGLARLESGEVNLSMDFAQQILLDIRQGRFERIKDDRDRN